MARRALSAAQLAVIQAVRAAAPQGADPLRVGLSGGADSLSLAAAVAHVGLAAEAMVVDHALQPGSGEVARRAARQAQGLGLVVRVVRVCVPATGAGLEADARLARLDALTHGAGAVLLGHTLDDQAETVLLGLGRGSGASSLQGMASRARWKGVPLVRPLLGLRRALVRQACLDWGLDPWDDPMNDAPRFRRVRVRHELLPLLDDVLDHGVVEALGRTARMLRDDNEFLDDLAARALADCRRAGGLDAMALGQLAPALATRVVRAWLVGQGVPQPTFGHVHAVLALVDEWRGQRGIALPGGMLAVRRDGQILLDHAPPSADG